MPLQTDAKKKEKEKPVRKSTWVFVHKVSSPDKFIIAKRSRKVRNSGQWNLFGGSLEDNLSVSDNAAKELREEAGIASHLIYNRMLVVPTGVFYYFNAIMLPSQTLRLNQENTDWMMVDWPYLRKAYASGKLDLHKSLVTYLKKVR